MATVAVIALLDRPLYHAPIGRQRRAPKAPFDTCTHFCMPPSRSTLISTALRRGLRKQCPHCGEGRLFSGWSHLERCSVCGLVFARNPGDTWAFTIFGDRLPMAAMIVLIYFGVVRSHRVLGGTVLVVLGVLVVWTAPNRWAWVSRCITCRECSGLILRILSRRLLRPASIVNPSAEVRDSSRRRKRQPCPLGQLTTVDVLLFAILSVALCLSSRGGLQ